MIIFYPFFLYALWRIMESSKPLHVESARIHKTTESPMSNSLSETIAGSSTMKAFGNQEHYFKKYTDSMEGKFLCHLNMHGCWMLLIFRVNFIVTCLLAASLSGCILLRFSISPILIGLVLQQTQDMFHKILGIMFCFGGYQRQKAEIQQCMNILEIPQE